MQVKVKSASVSVSRFQLTSKTMPIKYFMLQKNFILLEYNNYHQIWDLEKSLKVYEFQNQNHESIMAVLPLEQTSFVFVTYLTNQIKLIRINYKTGKKTILTTITANIQNNSSFVITGTIQHPILYYSQFVTLLFWYSNDLFSRTLDKSYTFTTMFHKQAFKIQFQIHNKYTMINHSCGVSGKLTHIRQYTKDNALLGVNKKNNNSVILYSLDKKCILKVHKLQQLNVQNIFLFKDSVFAIGSILSSNKLQQQKQQQHEISCQQCFVKSQISQKPFKIMKTFTNKQYIFSDIYPAVTLIKKINNALDVRQPRVLFLLEQLGLEEHFGNQIYKAVYNNLF